MHELPPDPLPALTRTQHRGNNDLFGASSVSLSLTISLSYAMDVVKDYI
jgi:hypothetical protein